MDELKRHTVTHKDTTISIHASNQHNVACCDVQKVKYLE